MVQRLASLTRITFTSNGGSRKMTDPNGAMIGVGGRGEFEARRWNQNVVNSNFNVDTFAYSGMKGERRISNPEKQREPTVHTFMIRLAKILADVIHRFSAYLTALEKTRTPLPSISADSFKGRETEMRSTSNGRSFRPKSHRW